MSAEETFPAKLVFVGGAPRSGTTIAHALLCTAPGASPYTPEISFFSFMVQAYWAGTANWDIHTHGLFPDRETFRRVLADGARSALAGIWRHLGEPQILCLKDPMLTPHFPVLSELLPEAKFVTICRHPHDVVRSRQEVHEKGGRGVFGPDDVKQVAEEYRHFYWTIFEHNFGERNFIFRYEDMEDAGLQARLAAFVGGSGFDQSRLWVMADGKKRDTEASQADPTHSPKYSGGLDLSPRLDALRPDFQEVVTAICNPIMRPMNYC